MAKTSAPLPRSAAGNAKAPAGEPDERGPATKVPEGNPEKEAAKSSRAPEVEEAPSQIATFVIEKGVARVTDDAEAIANADVAISINTAVIRDKMQFDLITRPLQAWLLNNAYPPRV